MTSIDQLFDTAIAALESQTEKSINPNTDMCQYRGPHGTKCLFGHMIADEHYEKVTDKFSTPVSDPKVLESIFASTGVDLRYTSLVNEINNLQAIHDHKWKPGQPFRPLIPEHLQLKIWGEVIT